MAGQLSFSCYSKIQSEAKGLEVINGFVKHLDGDIPLNVVDIFGGVTWDSSDRIIGSEATAFTYLIKQEEEDDKYPESNRFLVERGNLWEQAFLEEMVKINKELEPQGYNVNFMSSGSWDRELQNALDSEVWLLQSAIALILLYTVAMLSRWSDGFVGTRGMLAVSGFLCIAISFAMSAGLCSYLGVVYSPLMGLMPFLLLGEYPPMLALYDITYLTNMASMDLFGWLLFQLTKCLCCRCGCG